MSQIKLLLCRYIMLVQVACVFASVLERYLRVGTILLVVDHAIRHQSYRRYIRKEQISTPRQPKPSVFTIALVVSTRKNCITRGSEQPLVRRTSSAIHCQFFPRVQAFVFGGQRRLSTPLLAKPSFPHLLWYWMWLCSVISYHSTIVESYPTVSSNSYASSLVRYKKVLVR